MNQAINEAEAAKILDLAVQTLRNWRHEGKGPKYLKIGRAVKYDVNDILEYMQQHKIDPERVRHGPVS